MFAGRRRSFQFSNNNNQIRHRRFAYVEFQNISIRIRIRRNTVPLHVILINVFEKFVLHMFFMFFFRLLPFQAFSHICLRIFDVVPSFWYLLKQVWPSSAHRIKYSDHFCFICLFDSVSRPYCESGNEDTVICAQSDRFEIIKKDELKKRKINQNCFVEFVYLIQIVTRRKRVPSCSSHSHFHPLLSRRYERKGQIGEM